MQRAQAEGNSSEERAFRRAKHVLSRSPLDTSWIHASGQHGRRHKQEQQRQLLIFTGLILAVSPPAGPQRKRLR